MSTISMIIEERAARLGKFLVGRLLPFREKRMVGPFVFVDHMGPAELGPDDALEVPPHPHIGLSTLTYLFAGHIMHRDSLGTAMEISPGAVNWMTAGRGIVHSERTPERLRGMASTLHGLQIWVALPAHLEDTDPSFVHVGAEEIPRWSEGPLSFALIAGEVMGRRSPVPVYSPLYLLEIKASERTTVRLGESLFGESALYILEGAVYSDGHTHEPKRILVADDASLCEFELEAGSSIYVFGGEPFAEGRHIEWNFVASNPERIERAKELWAAREFPTVPGDDGYVPLPPPRLNPQ